MQGTRRKVFISRTVNEESPILKSLPEKDFEVLGYSLVAFSALPFEVVPKADWFFFYSSRGVKYFFEGLSKNKQQLPKQAKLATIGPATAQTLQTLGYTADFTGLGAPDLTAKAFEPFADHNSVAFVRAENSAQSVQKMLRADVTIWDLPVYKNEIKKEFEIPTVDYVVLTSSLNAKAYFTNYSIKAKQYIIAIGIPTADTIRNLTGVEVLIPKMPGESAIASLILEIEKHR